VESGNCKVSFILNRGIVTEVTPWSRDALQACARSGSGNETIMSERGRPWYLKVRINFKIRVYGAKCQSFEKVN